MNTPGRWLRTWQVGRLQFKILVMKHTYSNVSDRWVIQPTIVYDRKERGGY